MNIKLQIIYLTKSIWDPHDGQFRKNTYVHVWLLQIFFREIELSKYLSISFVEEVCKKTREIHSKRIIQFHEKWFACCGASGTNLAWIRDPTQNIEVKGKPMPQLASKGARALATLVRRHYFPWSICREKKFTHFFFVKPSLKKNICSTNGKNF